MYFSSVRDYLSIRRAALGLAAHRTALFVAVGNLVELGRKLRRNRAQFDQQIDHFPEAPGRSLCRLGIVGPFFPRQNRQQNLAKALLNIKYD